MGTPSVANGHRRRVRVGTGFVAVALPLALAACGGSTPAASRSSTTTGAGGTSAHRTTTTTAAPATTTTAPATTTTAAPATTTTGPVTLATVPMQTPTGGEFLSPSGNISCEVNHHLANRTGVYCQTLTPPQSVALTATGTVVTRCSGQQCLGNHGLDTPTLYYGQATGAGPYRCVSATTGVTCTANGKGFKISKSGITSVATP